MQIITEDHGDILEMRVAGRLDNEWADHLTQAIDEAVRLGSHSVVLNLTDVVYLSSAGIGALVRAHKQFQAIRGFFGVGVAPPHIAEVIRLTGLAKMLQCDMTQVLQSRGGARSTLQPMFRVAAEAGMAYELYEVDPGAVLTCEVIGDSTRLPRQSYAARDCHMVEFPAESLGLGLGAFGRDFADCGDRLGEFLAVAGATAQLPTGGTGKPDYQLGQGKYVPQVQVAYGLKCRGGMRQMQRFEPADEVIRVPLSKLVDQCLTLSETDLAGMVFIAETSGLIGTMLRRAPAGEAEVDKLSHPEIRRWLSFSPERVHSHSLALIVGVAARGNPSHGAAGDLAPLLRSMGPGTDIYGHFHAAVFSYRPFKKRKLDLAETVATLFETADLQTVMHLLNDDREITGGGESEFLRGACWLSPITHVTRETLK
ncbi:MAG: STAS domain-containing protein [Planctomycetes bacterium]|nr:STAS domain-containing protein [Planctomycetota bacterium]